MKKVRDVTMCDLHTRHPVVLVRIHVARHAKIADFTVVVVIY